MFKILMKSIREYKKASILTPLFVTLEVIMECCLPLLTAELINRMEDNNIKIMIYLMIALVVLASLGLLFGFLSAKYAAEAASGFAKNLRHDLYYKIQDFSFENIDKFSASSLVTRMTTDVANVQMSYGMIIRTAVRSPLMLIFSIIMAFTLNAKIAGIILCIAPLVALSFFIVAKCAMPLFDKVFKKYDKLNESIQENINGIRVVKTYVREDYEQDKFDKAADEVCNDFTKSERIVAINYPVINILDGAVINSSGNGLYIAGDSTFNIGKVSISGIEAGIGMKAGILNINGASVDCSGLDKTPTSGNNNGIKPSGTTIQLESNNGYAGDMEININGGNFTSKNSSVIYEYIGKGNDSLVKSINILNGTFISKKKDVFNFSNEFENMHSEFISGGIFSSNPDNYLKSGYKSSMIDNMYNVTSSVLKEVGLFSNGSLENSSFLEIAGVFFAILMIGGILYINRRKILKLF